MTNILSSFYEKLRDSVFVSEIIRHRVALTKKGPEYIGLCPFHGEKTPSFTVNDRKKFYHCFGCGAHGDLIKFESEISGISYRDSAFQIAEKYGIDKPTFSKAEEESNKQQDRLHSIMKAVTEFYISNMNPSIEKILSDRKINIETITQAKIGFTASQGDLINFLKNKNFSESDLISSGLINKGKSGHYEFFRNKIMIPIISNFGKIIGFGARALGDEIPKYINSSESIIFKKGESLYGEDVAVAQAYKSGYFILVEGYFDVLMLRQHGFGEAVASLGTAVTINQLEKLWKTAPEIIICLDGDNAGLRAGHKVINTAISNLTSDKKISFINLPAKKDPDDILQEKGKIYFEKLISNRIPLSEQIFRFSSAGKNLTSPEAKTEFENLLKSYSDRIKDDNLKKNYQLYFKKRIWELYNGVTVKNKGNINSQAGLNEFESLNALILALIINHYKKIEEKLLDDALIKIINSDSIFAQFSSYILDYKNDESNNKADNLLEFTKNTSFYKEFEILSAEYKNSIPSNLEMGNMDDIMEFYMNKKYLLELTGEFSALLSSDSENLEKRTEFYIAEIKRIKEKINKYTLKLF